MVTEIRELVIPPIVGNGNGVSVSPFRALPNLESGFSPSRIVSLWQLMKPFDASFWMGTVQGSTPSRGADTFSEVTRKLYLKTFRGFRETVTELGLPCAGATVDKLIKGLTKPSCTRDDVCDLLEELRPRLIDEMKGREFFILTTQEAAYYHNPRDKWEEIIERFPSAGNDVEESWKCLACSRYTAAVFHSLQVVEIGLIELGSFIGITDPLSGWTSVAQRLKKILDTKYDQLSQFEKDNRSFLEQTQGTVEGLKNAWRNKISHAHGKLFVMMGEEFHPDVAEEILIATRAFMRRLAEGLPTPPPES